MANKKSDKIKLRQKLTEKYRMVILNEKTFEERFALKLSRFNVFILGGLFSVMLIAGTIVLIAFTPIKEYIPGYDSSKLKLKAVQLTFQTDSLKERVAVLENYANALRPILTGDVTGEPIDSIQNLNSRFQIDESKLNATLQDSLFREKIESKDRFPLIDEELESKARVVFFAPITGTVSQQFDPEDKHFAIDVVAKTGTPVKAVADGTVIFSEWTTETGYVIIIKHDNNFISVYKHNGTLLKEQGDFVKSGEAIASVGSTGELTTGPHLHFELWSDGYAVNPTNYIDFK